jgi:hypothetical protein
MAAIWLRLASELRARRRGTLALVLLLVVEQLGVVLAPEVPLPALLAMLALVPAALVVVDLAAVVPGWLAARIRPAEALRAE